MVCSRMLPENRRGSRVLPVVSSGLSEDHGRSRMIHEIPFMGKRPLLDIDKLGDLRRP